jgi:exopolyphosphatase/pppGpp-phosphohydrolase
MLNKPFLIPGEASKTVHVAYDIGSGGIKVSAALINEQSGAIEEVFLEQRLPIQFARDMLMNKGSFTNSITHLAAHEIKQVKDKVTHYFSDGLKTIVHQAVATAAFRQAENGKEAAKEISDLVGFNIHIINCKQEGLLAFQSARTQFVGNDMVVFDLGGGSVQFTGMQNSQIYVCGIPIGVETFTGKLQEHLRKPAASSLNPFNFLTTEATFELANQIIDSHMGSIDEIKAIIKEGANVVGVGAVHNIAIYPIITTILGSNANYSVANIELTITKLLDKSDEELLEIEPNPIFAQILLPTLIFNLALMNALEITDIQLINVANTLGLLKDGIPKEDPSSRSCSPTLTRF